jgi:sigma-E factor negative regulatory protein RseC
MPSPAVIPSNARRVTHKKKKEESHAPKRRKRVYTPACLHISFIFLFYSCYKEKGDDLCMMSVGVVRSVNGRMAKVLVEAGGGCCDHCGKEACDINTRGVETEAVNLVDAKVGQKVRVDMKTFTYLKGVMLLYVLPVLALLFGAVSGRVYLPAYFHSAGPDVLSAAGGFLSLFASLVLVRVLSGRMDKKTEHKPVIESIITGQ